MFVLQTVCDIDHKNEVTYTINMKGTSGSPQGRLYVPLGRKIKEVRERVGLTQASLAEASSLSRTSITNIEKGRQHLPLHTLYVIAQALGVKVADLLPETKGSADIAPADNLPGSLDKSEREWIQHAVSATVKPGER